MSSVLIPSELLWYLVSDEQTNGLRDNSSGRGLPNIEQYILLKLLTLVLVTGSF